MNPKIYNEKDLPWAELVQLGLAAKGKLLLAQSDQDALLSSRRTALRKLSNLQEGNLQIGEIDVKLSLKPDEKGKLRVQAHPIHNYPERPFGLSDQEAAQLISGEKMVIFKKLEQEGQPAQEAIFEYDPETREFIKSDPVKITVPDRLNGEELTPEQRKRYSEGKEIELKDGTNLRYTGVDTHPIRADRMLLIASIIIDGGLTYVAYHGLKTLAGFLNKDPKGAHKSEAYNKTFAEMEAHNARQEQAKLNGTEHQHSYTRSGRSR